MLRLVNLNKVCDLPWNVTLVVQDKGLLGGYKKQQSLGVEPMLLQPLTLQLDFISVT